MMNITVELEEGVQYEEIDQVFQNYEWSLDETLTEANLPDEAKNEYENGVYELSDVELEDGERLPQAFVEMNDENFVPGKNVSSAVRFSFDGVYDEQTRETMAETVKEISEYGETKGLPAVDRENYGEMSDEEILDEYVERGPMVHVGTDTFGH